MTSNSHLFSFLILCNHSRMVLSRNLATSILQYLYKDPYHRSMTKQILFYCTNWISKKEELSCKVHIIDIWAPIKPILHIIECYVVSHAFRKIEPLLFIICAWEFPVTSFLNIYMDISFHIAVESNNRNQHIVIIVALSYCRLYVYVQEKQKYKNRRYIW